MYSKSNLKNKLLLLEVNEIPWRVIDKFKNNPDFPWINKYFTNARTYTTEVDYEEGHYADKSKLVYGTSKEGKGLMIDSGELSPWVTWPTFHRGIKSNEHGIRFLGQDVKTFKGKPIWMDFLEAGLDIGVCGSLQSWPPIYPGKKGFYIPDTFAHDAKCFPEYIENFQRFNLEQVEKNRLVVRQNSIFSKNLLKFLLHIPRYGISPHTLFMTFNQLVKERLNKSFLARRVVFQGIISWDIFKSLYKAENPPAFATFFTNHFASLMHRYWHEIFPEDLNGSKYQQNKGSHDAVMFGMEIVDKILMDAMKFCEKNPDLVIAFATSMGQEAINYTSYEGYSLEIENVKKLLEVLGIEDSDYKILLAMVPQVAIEVDSADIRNLIKKAFESCFTVNEKPVFACEGQGKTLSITVLKLESKDIKAGKFIYKSEKNGSMDLAWESSGVKVHKLDAATGYHISSGIFALYGSKIKPSETREKIKLHECKSMLLELAFSQN